MWMEDLTTSTETHMHREADLVYMGEFSHAGTSALIAYLRSVCRFPGNLVDKHTCSSQGCFHTHPDRHTLQDSPNIHPHLGQRAKAVSVIHDSFFDLSLCDN